MDLAAIRDRIKALLDTVDGLRAYEFVPDQVVVPAATVAPAPGNFSTLATPDGARDVQLVVTVLVQRIVDDDAQRALDAYVSEGDLDLEELLTTGSTADWDFTSAGPERSYGIFTYGAGEAAAQYLGFELPVLVAVS